MPGPYVQMATICEKVLTEADGVVSVIRAIDRIAIRLSGAEAPSELPPGNIGVTLLVMLKSDDARGRHPIKLKVQEPAGTYLPEKSLDVMFEGEERGVNLVLKLSLEAIEGLYWFEIKMAERLLTRVPLRVMYQRVPGDE